MKAFHNAFTILNLSDERIIDKIFDGMMKVTRIGRMQKRDRCGGELVNV